MYWIYRAFDTANQQIFETRVAADSEMLAYFEGLRHLADAMRTDQLIGRRSRDTVEPIREMDRPVSVERGVA